MEREGEYAWKLVRLYLAIVQAVLVFGAKTWVFTVRIGILLGGFHIMVVRRIVGRKSCQWADGIWDYPPLEEAIWEVGLKEMDT